VKDALDVEAMEREIDLGAAVMVGGSSYITLGEPSQLNKQTNHHLTLVGALRFGTYRPYGSVRLKTLASNPSWVGSRKIACSDPRGSVYTPNSNDSIQG
jgi:hypothetical protein